MQGDDERRGDAEQDVKVEPVFSCADSTQPSPSLAKRIEKDYGEHCETEETELHTDLSAWLQQSMLLEEWPFERIRSVVVETVAEESRDQCDHHDITRDQQDAMPGNSLPSG